MLRALYTAASGMTAQQFNIDTISNNLANASTTGYKKVRPEFQDLIYLTLQQAGADPQGQQAITGSPPGLYVGLGVRPSGSQAIFQQGNLQPTENPLDVALSGPGFFTVGQDQGGSNNFYTRDGSFKRDASGEMVTSDGYYVLNDSGSKITFPANTSDISIARDGTISCTVTGEQTAQEVGKLGIAQFANPAGMERVGHNLYQATGASGTPVQQTDSGVADYTVEQYNLESSNVQVVEEMVNLITAQRAYELNSKAIQASDEMLGIANGLRR